MTDASVPHIFRPNIPQLDPEAFLKRYDKSQEKRSRSPSDETSAMSRRRSRRDDPSRLSRRRQMLSDSYKAAIDQVVEHSIVQAIINPASEEGTAKIQTWLPKKADRAYFGLCTLGKTLDLHLRELTVSDMAAAAVLNEVALAWIIAVTQEMRKEVAAKVKPEGFRVGAAYRPGVGRWPLHIQEVVFAELPSEQIGVTLTDSYLMLPSLSTSIVIPIIPDRDNTQEAE